ncbi:MAG: uracil-DNA glycosylase family protein [Halanaeroarchaeum sp.]
MSDLDVAACRRCPALVESRSQIVNGVGPADASLLFVGEAPGETEDERGEPFVGRSGSILDEALAENGLEREEVRITNGVRCRPPDNRDPRVAELEHCRTHLDAEIDAVDPDAIVTLGKVPSEHLLGRDVSVTAEAGSIEHVDVRGDARTVVVCLHPAATLYDRSQREAFVAAIGTATTLIGAADGDRPGEKRDAGERD